MAIIKCKMCGGDLELVSGATVAECEYCGSRQTVPSADNEKKLMLFARANRLRAACEFDKAAGIYESIIADFPEEAEAYWGLVLCKYGIEYVTDPASEKKVPTCHRSSFDSVLKDSNFELAQEYADVVARKVCREEAKAIEEIRRGIVEVSAREAPYDIFICYKETDFDGKRTLDSVLAQDLYDSLTDKGYRVFFARITLEDKLGQEYEPYIFAALNSAKIMLVVGTEYEYFNSVWVKNEWSRYLKLMAKDKEKHLIPCYKGLDAYDMPEEFARLQAQDLGKMGATQDILRGVEKLLPKSEPVKETVVIQQGGVNVSAMLKRGNMALEDGQWTKAEGFFEEVLNQNPECAEAYLGLAMCVQKVITLEALVNANKPTEANYRRAKQFADQTLLTRINDLEKQAAWERERVRKAEEERRRAEEEQKAAQKREAAEKAEAQRRQAEEKRAQEQKQLMERVPYLEECRKKLAPAQGLIALGGNYALGLRSDGTVTTAAKSPLGATNVGKWNNLVAVCASISSSFGLRSDGTVISCGDSGFGDTKVGHWRDITAIDASFDHSIGLRSDGTVVFAGGLKDCPHVNVTRWKNLKAISTGINHTVGLRSDGTVVGLERNPSPKTDLKTWGNIVAIGTSTNLTVGLTAFGTVLATGTKADHPQEKPRWLKQISEWKDIVAVDAGNSHVVGLRADGTVVAVGENDYGQCDVSNWKNIVAIHAEADLTVGLRSDGRVEICGRPYPENMKTEMETWRLFDSFENLEEEKTDKGRRAAGLCRHCGGELKGLFKKICASCGKPKDY